MLIDEIIYQQIRWYAHFESFRSYKIHFKLSEHNKIAFQLYVLFKKT